MQMLKANILNFLFKLKVKVFDILGGRLLSPLERVTMRNSDDILLHPPIFFLGAPRSGTTLAMQVITDVFDLGYLSNFHRYYYGAPGVAEKLFDPNKGRPQSNYRSKHGETIMMSEPSESSQWWYRFFRKFPRYVDLSGADKKKMVRFRKSIQSMIIACKKPVLYKNPHAALRIQPIAKYIPESLFIIMKRDEVENAHSLLEVRKKVHKDYQKWWSMEPPSIDELKKLPAHEQVVEQIRHIHSTIDQDLRLSGVGPSRCFSLKYEDLCDNPEKEMDRLQAFFKSNHCRVARRFEPPAPFSKRNEIRIDKVLYEKVKKYAEKS